MKVSADVFEKQLKPQTLQTCYWLNSDDVFLREQAEQKLRQAAKQAGFEESLCFQIGVDFDTERFAAETQNLNLFSTRKLILVRTSKPLDSKLGEYFGQYAEKPNPDLIVVISSEKPATKATKWQILLEKHALSVTFWPVTRQQLNPWLTQHAKNLGLHVDAAAIQMLSEVCEGNLGYAHQVLSQIQYQGLTKISTGDIEAYLSNQSQYTVFQLAEAIFLQDSDRTLQILAFLEQHSAQELPAVIGFLTSEFLTLGYCLEQSRNQPLAQVFQENRIWPQKQAQFQQALKHYTTADLQQILTTLHTCDLISKGVKPGDPWEALQHLFARH